MPDILIRMEMPKSCVDCHDADLPTAIAWLEAKCPCAYGMNKQGVHDLRNKRHPDCPLHELPPHGDLISKQTVLAALYSDYAYAAMDIIEKEVPVVVPAEKGEK